MIEKPEMLESLARALCAEEANVDADDYVVRAGVTPYRTREGYVVVRDYDLCKLWQTKLDAARVALAWMRNKGFDV